MTYLHTNPVRAGIVRFEQDYLYSSGIDYYGDEKGLIAVDYIGLRLGVRAGFRSTKLSTQH